MQGEEADIGDHEHAHQLDRDRGPQQQPEHAQPPHPARAEPGLQGHAPEHHRHVEAGGDGEQQRLVQQDVARERGEARVEHDQRGRRPRRGAAPRQLPRRHEGGRGERRAQHRHGAPHGRHLGVRAEVLARLEAEGAVVSDHAADAGNEQLAEGRVHVEEVGPVDVPARELAEVRLVPADLAAHVEAVEAGGEAGEADQPQQQPPHPARPLLLLALRLGVWVRHGRHGKQLDTRH